MEALVFGSIASCLVGINFVGREIGTGIVRLVAIGRQSLISAVGMFTAITVAHWLLPETLSAWLVLLALGVLSYHRDFSVRDMGVEVRNGMNVMLIKIQTKLLTLIIFFTMILSALIKPYLTNDRSSGDYGCDLGRSLNDWSQPILRNTERSFSAISNNKA